MGQFGRLTQFSRQFLIDRRYRNHVMDVINRHVQAEAGVETRQPETESASEWLRGKRMFLVGGCELTYIKHVFDNLGVETHHTFDHGASSEPLAEASNSGSALWTFEADYVVLSQVQVFRGIVAKVQTQGLMSSRAEVEDDLAAVIDSARVALRLIRARSNKPVFLMTYPLVLRPAHGVHDYRSIKDGYGLVEVVRAYELAVYGLAREFADVFVLDVNMAMERGGKEGSIQDFDADAVYEHFTRQGASQTATMLVRQLSAIEPAVARVKCVAIDLDGTLWTGVLREDGPTGVSVRQNYLVILEHLARRGLILAVCSKNDEVERTLLTELLGESLFKQFVAVKLNWRPKSENLKLLAMELNIGLDSIAYFDDNPAERAEIAANAPAVRVYSDTELLSALERPEFEPLGEITHEAATRTLKYIEQSQRELVSTSSASLEEFLRSSNLQLSIRRPAPTEVPRVSELLQRTNQLNATLRRTSLDEVQSFYAEPERYELLAAHLLDRFGDYGLIGLAFAERGPVEWRLLELAFSCRAMGKHVEHAVLLDLARRARANGSQRLVIDFLPTERNGQMLEILRELSFQEEPNAGEQTNCQQLHLVRHLVGQELPFPDWLNLA